MLSWVFQDTQCNITTNINLISYLIQILCIPSWAVVHGKALSLPLSSVVQFIYLWSTGTVKGWCWSVILISLVPTLHSGWRLGLGAQLRKTKGGKVTGSHCRGAWGQAQGVTFPNSLELTSALSPQPSEDVDQTLLHPLAYLKEPALLILRR